MTDFLNFNFDKRILKALDLLNFSQATSVQSKVIPKALAGSDLLVSSKTGTGKTASFLLPIIQRCLLDDKPNSTTRALILVPTRELALQIQKVSNALCKFCHLKTGLVIGGEAFKHQVASVRRNPEIIVATPGRLVEHLEKKTIDFHDLEFLILDEADLMLQMGFAEDMHTIIKSCRPERQILLFSATLKHAAIRSLRAELNKPQSVVEDDVVHSMERIQQHRVLVDDDKHREAVLVEFLSSSEEGQAIVFCNTRKQVQKLSNILQSKKIRSAYLHGELSQSDRKQILHRFRRGDSRVLVASDVAARGIDILEVKYVINFSTPHSGDEYLHRIGRTGRSDKKGSAITFVSEREWDLMSSIERYLKVRLSTLIVKGFKANYSGPKKLKKSGKAASTKKRKDSSKKMSANKSKNPANKTSSKMNKSTTKKSQSPKITVDKSIAVSEKGGWAPLKKKR